MSGNEKKVTLRQRGRSKSQPIRCDLYPHAPECRSDLIEESVAKNRDTDVFEHLKLPTFQGVYNLSLLLLVFFIFYIGVRSVFDRGIQVDVVSLLCYPLARDLVRAMVISTGLFLWSFISFVNLKLFCHGPLPEVVYPWAHVVAIVGQVGGCAVGTLVQPMSPVIAMSLAMLSLTLAMKMHSYFATNLVLCSSKIDVAELDQSTLTHFTYFLAAPTLVFEPEYPRTASIRWSYVVSKALEMLLCIALQAMLMAQFVLPVVQDHTLPVWYEFIKMAVPTFFFWVLGFVGFFHCLLNINAELLRFADRRFYEDWWNATSLDTFWRQWNCVVHEWALRHVYVESMHYWGVSKSKAFLATFVVSAVLHELVFSIAFRSFHAWFFVGMVFQVPVIMLSQRWKGHRRGNLLMWWSLFSSQPMLQFWYLRDWFRSQDGLMCVTGLSATHIWPRGPDMYRVPPM